VNTSIHSTGLRGLIATAIFGALTSSFSAIAAADDAHPVSITVKYADLNPANPPDALRLYERIRQAALAACAYYWFKTDADEARCVHSTIANAVSKVNQPELFAVFNAKDNTSAPRPLVSSSR
jgi:UrcA family protein